jgi:hypothetical protein
MFGRSISSHEHHPTASQAGEPEQDSYDCIHFK